MARKIGKILTGEARVDATFEMIEEVFSRPGVSLTLSMIDDSEGGLRHGYDSVAETGLHEDSDLSILESLGLIRYVVLKTGVVLKKREKRRFEVMIFYHHLTNLGIEFCEVCSKPRVDELEAINLASRAKGKTRQDPLAM